MTELLNIKGLKHIAKLKADIHRAKEGSKFLGLFRSLRRMIVVFALLATAYWSLIASDRYVSEANVIIRKTDSVSVPSIDISMLVSGVGGVDRTEQLLLREYLLSVDMLKKIDAIPALVPDMHVFESFGDCEVWLKHNLTNGNDGLTAIANELKEVKKAKVAYRM